MEDREDERPVSIARRRVSRRRVALGVALILIAALVALWIVRKPIAARFVDRTLAAAKVPARYTIADLALGGQRLTDVVIGDPASPDLVADWIETRTRVTLNGPELSGVRAGHVRLRGRLIDGRLSLGAIDRLLPKSGGGGVSLPKLDLEVADARMRLETPYGVAGVSLIGKGRLDDGFDGRVAVVGERLGATGCEAERVATALRVATARAGAGSRVAIAGPVRAAVLRCAGVRVASWRSDLDAAVTLGTRLSWTARTTFDTNRVRHRAGQAVATTGSVALRGDAAYARGDVAIRAETVSTAHAQARALTVNGVLAVDPAGISLGEGRPATASVSGARLSSDLLRRADAIARLAPGTPVAPLLARAARASRAAGALFDATATFGLVANGGDGGGSIRTASARSASGAILRWTGDAAVSWGRDAGVVVAGRLGMNGGGLPDLVADVAQSPGATRRITLRMQPYEAPGARLALAPVAITGGGATHVVTRATLSGPLADGRVDGLTMPLDLRLANGALTLNAACTPLAFQRFAIAGLALRPASLTLCPIDRALIRSDANGLHGGARVSATKLAGSLGTTPLTLALTGATLRLADRGFAIEGVETRIGAPQRVTRLDFARIEGRMAGGGVAGTFAGGAGQIANVPLLLSQASGDWRFAQGRLALTGALAVADAQAANPRFQPMQARDVALSLVDGDIAAKGVLHEPTTGAKVADVSIAHALGPGAGHADLGVPGLSFAKGFQPELLTRLTFGVIADVNGAIAGDGHIAWDAQGVRSTGVFRTAGTDLAAAFGPVTGIAGEIRFTDLLALESAPGQVVTIKSVNPGIAVTDGAIRYRTLPNAHVQVDGGEWPFAGGRLTLDPTLLDFSQAARRRMTFRVNGVAADRFLQQFDFKNLDATGTFDGVMPMVFDESGGRIDGGALTVREGGGTIRYVGEITEKDVGFWGNLAFQALKSLRYRSLTLGMNGPLAGEMVTEVRFAGVSQGEGAKANFLVRGLQRLPFVFNIRIKAPFRGLLDSAQSFYDPRRLIQRNLPALLEDQSKRASPPVQPPASVPVPMGRKD